jgi:formylglycine-generating enzyme required for sulfatase activity
VINVSWEDAKAYCAWLGEETRQAYRLPSEAEWEYACRAGTTTPFWTGATISTERANYDGNYTYGPGRKGEYRARTTPVEAFESNPWGLHDMHGNVWEWCEDRWHDNYRGAPNDGSAWLKGKSSLRVVRGGSWGYFPRDLRSAYRVRFVPVDRYFYLGFRVSRMLTP